MVEPLDGDVVRTHLSKGLGFSKEDRDTNIQRIGWVASRITRHGGVTVVSAISPYEETRQAARELVEAFGPFVCVHVHASVDECVRRDTKGLYAKAIAGEIKEFTGISDPYEEPLSPELTINTEGESPEESAERVVAYLEQRGLVRAAVSVTAGLIPPHGGELVTRTGERPDGVDQLERITLSRAPRSPISDMLASGALSPLRGFMGRADYQGSVEGMHLADGTIWALPVTLAVAEAPRGERVALASEDGTLLATLDVGEVFSYDARTSTRPSSASARPTRSIPASPGSMASPAIPLGRGHRLRSAPAGLPPIWRSTPRRRARHSRSAAGSASSAFRRATRSTARTST